MTETTIERLARVLASTSFRDDKIWDDMDENDRLWHVNAVRAVLTALMKDDSTEIWAAAAKMSKEYKWVDLPDCDILDDFRGILQSILTEPNP